MGSNPSPSQLAGLHQYIGARSIGLSIAFIVIDTVVFIARTVCRYTIKRSPQGWDDFIMPVAWFAQMIVFAITIVSVKMGGVGRHFEEVVAKDPHEIVVTLKCIYAIEFAYLAAISLPKLAILNLYLRLFTSRFVRVASWILIGYICALWFASFVFDLVQCTPIAYNWDRSILGGHCIKDQANFVKALGPIEVAPDIVMIFLPIPIIWKLRMSTSRRLGLIGVLSAGVVGTIFGIVRMVVFFTVNIENDITWNDVTLSIWANLEPSLYFIAAALPGCSALGPYLHYQNLRSSIKSRFGSSRRDSNGGPIKSNAQTSACRPRRSAHEREHLALELVGRSLLQTDGTGTFVGTHTLRSYAFPEPGEDGPDEDTVKVRTDIMVEAQPRQTV